MNTLTTFDSTKESLLDLVRSIGEGKTQLPDFQRGWVWDDKHICDLLASISLAYPIGAVMMLQTGNSDVRFKPRLIEGVTLPNPPEPERLILDGQQRLTSLFQALFSGQPVLTRDARGKQIRRLYCIDIAKSLNPNADREEAIVSWPADRIVRDFRGNILADFSTPEREYEAGLFPLAQVFDSTAWRRGHNRYFRDTEERLDQFDRFEVEVMEIFKQYQIPLIVLRKETPKSAICQVFEKVNTGGVSLTVFELLTATFAADDFNLREDWLSKETRLKPYPLLSNIQNTDFLQAVTLLATRDRGAAISCKRKDVLKLSLADYKNWAEPATLGFEKAAKLLYGQKLFSDRDLPYGTQLTPLAAILAVLGERGDSAGVKDKLVRWYWCGVFGELYGGAADSRFAKDLPEVLSWIDGGSEPDTITSANFVTARLLSLRTRNSAAYKGLYVLLMRDGGLDFRTGETIETQRYFEDKIDIHHIFPKDWCEKQGIDAKRCNSIVNKTPVSAKTNRIISNKAPSIYLASLQNSAGILEERMDEILRAHLIDPAALRADNFDAFFQARKETLLNRIEEAMGKPIPREAFELEDAEPADWEDETDT